MEQAFEKLPEDYREVILLVRVAGLPYAAAAEQMGRTEPSIRNLLSRALSRLSGMLVKPKASD